MLEKEIIDNLVTLKLSGERRSSNIMKQSMVTLPRWGSLGIFSKWSLVSRVFIKNALGIGMSDGGKAAGVSRDRQIG